MYPRRLAGPLLVLALPSLPAALPAQTRPPIIDMHMHTHHPADIPAGEPALCRPDPCEGKGAATATPEASLRGALAQMDRYHIVKAFVSGPDPGEVRRWADAAPDRILPGVFILQPGQPAPEALRAALETGRLSGIGEVATQLTGHAPNDPALEPYFALAEEYDVPLLIHTEGIGPRLPGFRSSAGNPLLLEDVLVRHPKLRIYVENTGYPFLDQMVAMMNQYPQLYGDLSTITWVIPRSAFYDYLRGLMDAGLGKRLMFGTDQMRWPEAIGWAVQAIDEAPFLTAGQKRDLFYNNAARFLRLDRVAASKP